MPGRNREEGTEKNTWRARRTRSTHAGGVQLREALQPALGECARAVRVAVRARISEQRAEVGWNEAATLLELAIRLQPRFPVVQAHHEPDAHEPGMWYSHPTPYVSHSSGRPPWRASRARIRRDDGAHGGGVRGFREGAGAGGANVAPP
ncbi:hypothetical protein DFH09DRAFT_1083306 [Mycena vulgaris]|nr:hypothetical protein DFH09DRAFT_1083306 [Mycena vulgaris]